MSNKEYERQELFKTIWKIADEQRGSIDGWDFKQYILTTLFYRFISENLINYINSTSNVDYINMKDEDISTDAKNEIINEKGFFIYPSQLFCNVIKEIKNKNFESSGLNEKIAKIFKAIESSSFGRESEQNIKGLFDDFDFNGTRLGTTIQERNARLKTLFLSINGMNFGNLKQNS
ncbi:MAG: type I restriction-modification system subunit M N-terminal domain-containing protein, partial [Mycoplasmataceae bacterium]|nr:type I restriction-modification system subunit M N-terminal domain-containing protein [Mycoplasmataceae bacterium]